VASGAIACVEASGAGGGFAIAAGEQIDGPEKDGAAGVLGALNEAFGDFPFVGDVELIPDVGAILAIDVLDGVGTDSRESHQAFLRTSGASSGEFAIGVEGALAAGRADEDGPVPGGAEDFGVGVDFAGVDEAAGAEFDTRVGFVIGAESVLVVDAGGHVTEVCGRDLLSRCFFEVHHIEGVFGAGQHGGSGGSGE